MYKYIGNDSKTKYIYSNSFTNNDSLPVGARNDIALRDKIKLINREGNDGIVSNGGNYTVIELNTIANYNFVVNILKNEDFGNKRIDRVKLSDAKTS